MERPNDEQLNESITLGDEDTRKSVTNEGNDSAGTTTGGIHESKNVPADKGTQTINQLPQSESVPALSAQLRTKNREYVVFGGFWIRFWAYMIDLIVIGSLNRLLVYPALRSADISIHETGMLSAVGIGTAIVMYLYFILMTKVFGQTLGKMIFGLKVIQKDERKLRWSTVIFRELFGRFISKTILFLGFLAIGFTPKKQGLHDWFADTIVIQEKKGFFLSDAKVN